MKKLLATLLFTSMILCSAFPQSKDIRRIYVRHADPQLILLLLGGKTNTQTPPEISTFKGGIFVGGNSGFGNSGFGGSSPR